MIEQKLFAGHDCIFTSVANPYGIKDYGEVIFRFKDKRGFAWGSMYIGHTWTIEVRKADVKQPPSDGMIRKFAKQIFTNNHWDEAMGLFIIENVRIGSTFRGRGGDYDKSTILDKLLSFKNSSEFWRSIIYHRLAFLEGHYTENVPLDHINFVQYRDSDKTTVASWGLSSAWFADGNSFIQFFNRTE